MNISEHFRTHERFWNATVLTLSCVVVALVAWLLFQSQEAGSSAGNRVYIFPKLNAIINSLVTLLLITGYLLIINRKITAHRYVMLGALGLSVLFLVSYVLYHYLAPHTPFGGEGFIRYVYYFILITHIVLAIAIVPMVMITLLRAFQANFSLHKKIAVWTLPIWLYVSITGVVIYLVIAPYYPV